MFHDRRDRLDWLLIRPFGMIFLIWGCTFAYRGEWFSAVTFLIGGFFGMVWINRKLLPDRSRHEIANPNEPVASKMDDENPVMFQLIAFTMFRLSFLLGTMFAIVAWHANAPWLRLILGTVGIYVGIPILVVLITCFPFHVRKPVAAKGQ